MLFRFAITAIFVHPLHRIACFASTSPFLPLILFVFSLPLAILSHPVSSHYAPSLTLSPRSSAKTSIRLSPVAPRYTDPTRASRRAPRVSRGNVDCTSPSSRRRDNVAQEHRASRATCAWLPARHDIILRRRLLAIDGKSSSEADKFYSTDSPTNPSFNSSNSQVAPGTQDYARRYPSFA